VITPITDHTEVVNRELEQAAKAGFSIFFRKWILANQPRGITEASA
jgi:hypothetical protein